MKTKLFTAALSLLAIIACDDSTSNKKEQKSNDENSKVESSKIVSFEKEMSLQGTDFKIEEIKKGETKELIVEIKGQENGAIEFKKEITSSVYKAEVEDLNSDGFPELIIFAAEDGSGSYGEVFAWSSNNGKSMSEIAFAQSPNDSVYFKGYAGHDEFEVVETSLMRKFPIYNEEDVNAEPTGGWRYITYKLIDGEAMRQFVITDIRDEE